MVVVVVVVGKGSRSGSRRREGLPPPRVQCVLCGGEACFSACCAGVCQPRFCWLLLWWTATTVAVEVEEVDS